MPPVLALRRPSIAHHKASSHQEGLVPTSAHSGEPLRSLLEAFQGGPEPKRPGKRRHRVRSRAVIAPAQK